MEEALVLQLLLALGLAAVLASLAFFQRKRSSITAHSRPAPAPTTRNTILVTDPAIVQRTLIDHADAFSDRPQSLFVDFSGTHGINSVPHGPTWRALRRNLTAGILHPTRLHLLAPLQQEAAEALVADLLSLSTTRDDRGAAAAAAAAGGEVVVGDSLHASVFVLTVRFCFGDGGVVGDRDVRAMEREVRQFILTFVQDSVLFGGSTTTTRLRHWRRWRRYSGTARRVYKLIHPIIAVRKLKLQSPRPRRSFSSDGGVLSYVDSLLDLQIPADTATDGENDDNGDATATATTAGSSKRRRPLTDKEMVRLVFEFLGATTESVVSCVEWTLAHLVMDPDVQRKLHREITIDQHDKQSMVVFHHRRLPPYLRAVILESLRLHPPVPLIARDVSASAKDDNAAIIGTPAIVMADIRMVGTNSKVWRDPDEFRPERFLAGGEAEGVGPVPGPKEIRMVPFGAGRRYCPGVELGMARVGCILAELVRHFQWTLPADGDDSPDLEEFRGFFGTMKTPLRARITPRVLTTT